MLVTDENLGKLKCLLREDTMPLLSEEMLRHLLTDAQTFEEAVYNAAIMKSENTQISVSGLSTPDNSAYFLRLAAMFRPNNTGTLEGG